MNAPTEGSPESPTDFIRVAVAEDVTCGRFDGQVVTRFPPEPSGYLHLGHAKAFCLNFSIAADFGGRCHLRMDDTNPSQEEQEYVDGIKADIHWMGFDWGEHEYHASDYFGQLYEWALQLPAEWGDEGRPSTGSLDGPAAALGAGGLVTSRAGLVRAHVALLAAFSLAVGVVRRGREGRGAPGGSEVSRGRWPDKGMVGARRRSGS